MFGLDTATGNLIIIISVLGILICVFLWFLRSLNLIFKNHDIKEVENYLSWIGVSMAFLILLMIFVTAGDLGILLLIGSLVSFLLMLAGLAAKNSISVLNTPGTIDSDYRGELKIILFNHSNENFIINNNDRVAQMVLTPIVKMELEEINELPNSNRGDGGFGSTGK